MGEHFGNVYVNVEIHGLGKATLFLQEIQKLVDAYKMTAEKVDLDCIKCGRRCFKELEIQEIKDTIFMAPEE